MSSMRSRFVLCSLLIAACGLARPGPGEPARGAGPSLADRYREAASRLFGAALVSDRAHETLGILCDRFGHRLAGSRSLEEAIDWAAERMRGDGLRNVRKDEVMVPVWVRGEERARLVEPVERPLNLLSLGGSVGTPEGGIEAEVAVVASFDELDRLGEAVKGKIVLYDVPFVSYGETVRYRSDGASRAARLGAVAALIRSVGPISYDTPHTGALSYEEGVAKIPAAALTIEGASQLHRMAERGDRLRLRLEMGARTLEDAPSANLIGEVVGSELPDEVVVVGGHFDSWDVGQGAQDDGVGCIIAWEAARLIHQLGLKPRRTIRVVLFTNEENGLNGGKDYAERHVAEFPGHVAAIESDLGNGAARGFSFEIPWTATTGASRDQRRQARENACGSPEAARVKALLEDIGKLLEPLGATRMSCGGSGADVGQMAKKGVLCMGLDHDPANYFDIHHTRADTFEKVDKRQLDRNVAVMAVMAYVLADMPGRLLEAPAKAPAGALVSH